MGIRNWIDQYRNSLIYKISEVSLDEIEGWEYKKNLEKIGRKDNAFFTIQGIKSENFNGLIFELPLIDQPEIGILGFILTKDEEGLKILLHAKSEPGNKFITQIGPSVQATESNYKIKHQGKPQKYIDFFLNPDYPKQVALKQSEQGNRFFNKYNANIIVQVEKSDIIIEGSKYRWFSLNEVIENFNTDYLFNTDFKSVFSHLLEKFILDTPENKKTTSFLNSYFNNTDSGISHILEEINKKRAAKKFDTSIISLNKLQNWTLDKKGVNPTDKKEFGFQFFDIEVADREVSHWGQPLITKSSIEAIELLCFEKNDELQFVFEERLELGFKNYLQLAPTIQYDFLNDSDKKTTQGKTLIQFSQTEEGGRFYNNISEYKVCQIDPVNEYINSDTHHILNLHQICQLLKVEGTFTNESRSIIASLVGLL